MDFTDDMILQVLIRLELHHQQASEQPPTSWQPAQPTRLNGAFRPSLMERSGQSDAIEWLTASTPSQGRHFREEPLAQSEDSKATSTDLPLFLRRPGKHARTTESDPLQRVS
jgi:hypothetical protein